MKPKVICHVMASVDGHLQVDRWSAPYPPTDKGEVMKVYPEIGRLLHFDAWTFGRNTVTEIFPDTTAFFDKSRKYSPEDETLMRPCMQPSVHVSERKSKRLFISFDPEANIIYTSSQLRGDDILCVLPMQKATPRYLCYLHSMNISTLVVTDFSDMRHTLESIHEHFGIMTISLQGGGLLNGGMLNSGLIDELSLIIYPGLDCQKTSVGLFDGVNPQAIYHTRLQLLSVQPQAHGAVWIRYKIHHTPPRPDEKRTSPHILP